MFTDTNLVVLCLLYSFHSIFARCGIACCSLVSSGRCPHPACSIIAECCNKLPSDDGIHILAYQIIAVCFLPLFIGDLCLGIWHLAIQLNHHVDLLSVLNICKLLLFADFVRLFRFTKCYSSGNFIFCHWVAA